MKKFQRGLTLVELIIVIVLLSGASGVVFVLGHFITKVW